MNDDFSYICVGMFDEQVCRVLMEREINLDIEFTSQKKFHFAAYIILSLSEATPTSTLAIFSKIILLFKR